MNKIAVFVDGDSRLCDFFNAERFFIFEHDGAEWKMAGETIFKKIIPSTPALTRKNTEALLPFIEGCNVLAGGALFGIPFSVFDRAGLHIFEIGEIRNEIFDGIIEDLRDENVAKISQKEVINNAKPTETAMPGVYTLDLVALQKEYPEISSKKAMMDFLKNVTFFELRLICKHIPPWIENSGEYYVQVTDDADGVVQATITRRC